MVLAFSSSAHAFNKPAFDTGILCAHRSASDAGFDVNINATLHMTSTSIPHALCLRRGKQTVDGQIMSRGHLPHCDDLPALMPRRGGLFVDVGANIGACSMLMASHGHRVISFEPTPPTFAALSAGLAGNFPNPGWDVRLVNSGVSNASGKGFIHVQQGNAGSGFTTGAGGVKLSAYRQEGRHYMITEAWQKYEIALTTLDEAVHEPVDLMKMDCQGHELHALRGAVELLKKHGVKVIKFEFFPPGLRQAGDEPIALLNFLDDAGYDIYGPGRYTRGEGFQKLVRRRINGFTDLIAYRRIDTTPVAL